MTISKYIGIPFKDNGRDFSGCDCYGLACLFYRNEFNIQLPEFSESYHGHDDVNSINQILHEYCQSWKESDGSYGDIIVFRGMNDTGRLHVGIYIRNNTMLHSKQGIGVCVEKFNTCVWKSRIEGIYHYWGKTVEGDGGVQRCAP